jgi:hypothetical protein
MRRISSSISPSLGRYGVCFPGTGRQLSVFLLLDSLHNSWDTFRVSVPIVFVGILPVLLPVELTLRELAHLTAGMRGVLLLAVGGPRRGRVRRGLGTLLAGSLRDAEGMTMAYVKFIFSVRSSWCRLQ